MNLQRKSSMSPPPPKKMRPMRYRIMLIFGVFILVLVVVLAVVIEKISRDIVLEQVETHLVSEAENAAKLIDHSIKNDFKQLETISHMSMFRDTLLSYKEKAIRLEKEERNVCFKDLYLIDNKGVGYFSDGKIEDASANKFFLKAAEGKNYLSEPYFDRFGTFCISASIPIYDNDSSKQVIGVLLADYDGLALNEYIEDIVVGKTGFCYILGKTGVVIAHPNEKYVMAQEDLIAQSKEKEAYISIANFVKYALSTGKGDVKFYTLDEERFIVSFAKIPRTGWTVIVKAPVDEFLKKTDRLRFFIIIISLITLSVALFIIFILADKITNPIMKVVSILRKISEGNLNVSLNYQENATDEIALLENSMFDMVEKLKAIVIRIERNVKSLSDVIKQINGASQQLSQGANEQAASTEEVSSAMLEMRSNIVQNANNAKMTEKVSLKVQEGVANVKKKAKEANQAHYLIDEKITVISDIAFKTNILALNAAIEAAQAGKHGKGFSVVATEVRKLAEQSKAAAEEIIALVKKSGELSDKAGESLSEIIPDIGQVGNLVQNISTASIEQNVGTEQVNNAIQQLNHVAQRNAATSEELATTSEEMEAQASRLKEAISYFKFR